MSLSHPFLISYVGIDSVYSIIVIVLFKTMLQLQDGLPLY